MAAAGSARPRIYLDIDVDGWRAAYQRAVDFVASNDLKYSLSSNVLAELGGSEKKRVRTEYYPNDYDWSSRGPIRLKQRQERIEIELWPDVAPLACENFLALVTGSKGTSTSSGKKLHYQGCPFHRIVPGFVAQAGDISFGNGTGGESIWGKKFKDDQKGLKQKFTERGLLAMGNTGKNSNTSQFFFALDSLAKLNGKHVIFGKMVSGEDVLKLIEEAGSSIADEGKPTCDVVIADCGLIQPQTCEPEPELDK